MYQRESWVVSVHKLVRAHVVESYNRVGRCARVTEEDMLAIGMTDYTANKVVEVYSIDVTEDGKTPTSVREKIRAEGPSVSYGHN